MYKILPRFCVSFLFLFTLISGKELDTAGVKRNFEWGEYDSLLLKLPSLLADSGQAPAGLRATFWQYLGAAYYMGGDTLRARECYTSAWKIDPGVVLDKKYLNDASGKFFLQVHLELNATRKDSVKSAMDPPQAAIAEWVEPKNPPGIPIPVVLTPKKKNTRPLLSPTAKRALGWGMVALGFGLAHFAITEQKENDEIFKKYDRAGGLGDSTSYHRLKGDLEDSNFKLIAFTTGAALSGSTGLFFAFYPFKKGEQPSDGPQPIAPEVGLQYRMSF